MDRSFSSQQICARAAQPLFSCCFGSRLGRFRVFADPRSGPDDALMIFRQLTVYSVTFGVFFGSSAIHSDQRSRRILAVLSKGFRDVSTSSDCW